jgi:uncharacterized phage protein gp47/JayE
VWPVFSVTSVGAGTDAVAVIAGIQSGGAVSVEIKGGADLEGSDSLRSRMLAAYQQAPQGGEQSDYEAWAESGARATGARCVPNGFGLGTVVILRCLMTCAPASVASTGKRWRRRR